jgi:hypothetical protein
MARKFLTPVTPPALASDPVIAPAGSIYYNTTLGTLKISNGSTWQKIIADLQGGANSIQVLSAPPSNPAEGNVYFDNIEKTIKAYNGITWYDVAGPKNILEHSHEGSGYVEEVQYSNYVDDQRVFADSGNINSSFIDNYIDGGNASGN